MATMVSRMLRMNVVVDDNGLGTHVEPTLTQVSLLLIAG